MAIEESVKEQVIQVLVGRVVENAPLRELVRVYSEAVLAAVGQLSEDDLVRSISAAGYTDIIEQFGLDVQEAPSGE